MNEHFSCFIFRWHKSNLEDWNNPIILSSITSAVQSILNELWCNIKVSWNVCGCLVR
jgi:hypothetical protein